MNGILIINKPKNITSRDVVNRVCNILNTKKVGHTGTLDPIAAGVLVLCVGNATKLVDLITSSDKEYIASVKLGVLTDTLDITGNILEKRKCSVLKDDLVNVLNSFIGEYYQEVPIYSAVKINGKKLYEYARENKDVILPKRKVTIKSIELLDFNKDEYKFKVVVSKGTYIRSLIKDINNKLGIIGSMSDLIRTRQGTFKLSEAYNINDIENNNFEFIKVKDAIKDIKKVDIDDSLYNRIKHGQILENIYKDDIVVFMYNNELIAIYKKYDKDESKIKPYKMFI